MHRALGINRDNFVLLAHASDKVDNMKKFTMYTVGKILDHLKQSALYGGRYPPPHTARRYDKRGKVPFRSMAYVEKVKWINALEDLIKNTRNGKEKW